MPDVEPLEPDLDDETIDEVRANLDAAYAESTRSTYAAAIRKLVGWIQEHHPEVIRPGGGDPLLAILPLHTVTLVDFITRVEVPYRDADGQGHTRLASAGTIGTYVSAIRSVHRQLGLADPTAHPLFWLAGVAGDPATSGAEPAGEAGCPVRADQSARGAAEQAAAAGARPGRIGGSSSETARSCWSGSLVPTDGPDGRGPAGAARSGRAPGHAALPDRAIGQFRVAT